MQEEGKRKGKDLTKKMIEEGQIEIKEVEITDRERKSLLQMFEHLRKAVGNCPECGSDEVEFSIGGGTYIRCVKCGWWTIEDE